MFNKKKRSLNRKSKFKLKSFSDNEANRKLSIISLYFYVTNNSLKTSQTIWYAPALDYKI